ncbi:MAG: hypothetical protein J4F41_08295 [Alphaproteobacteria bacterium]|nr:hypothetical protein [Alphaproteobacteria bacterium]
MSFNIRKFGLSPAFGLRLAVALGLGVSAGLMAPPALAEDTARFNTCMKDNESVLLQQRDLVLLCLGEHSSTIDRTAMEARGQYQARDNGVVFLLEMGNTTEDMLVTSYAVIVKHEKAEQAQVFNLTPVSILPGRAVTVPLGPLNFVPEGDDLTNGKFEFGVDQVRGLKVVLK